ncbi:hypothetical protein OF83DRAFT_1157917 [Amylostereum chailletii]|nr:hypothetical protein OF83DRAFT_1157917 [Amylostereum chailletii]
MAVFNPKMLDASVRDVVSALTSDQKTDVLLYAMERIPSGPNSRTTVENAVQSVIQVSSARPDKLIQARLIRAKARFAAGMRGAAHQDLQTILQIDPGHREAASLMPSGVKCISGEFGSRRGHPRFSNEIWREIATYLEREDLRALLFVPHTLSAIASQLLFRTVHLHFGTSTRPQGDTVELDEWHARRSAEILSHLVSNAAYASYVQSFAVFAPEKYNNLTSFQIAMVTSVLPRLVNLKMFGCRMSGRAMQVLLASLEKIHPKLENLVLEPITPLSSLPTFPALRKLAYNAGDNQVFPKDLQQILDGRSIALRHLVLYSRRSAMDARLPVVNNLTSLEVDFLFTNPECLATLLSDGRHLENLSIGCLLTRDCQLSTAFRSHVDAVPSLRRFHFHMGAAQHHVNDPDLFPAVTEFVRQHPHLRSLRLQRKLDLKTVGYNADVWSVLPALLHLEDLALDIPRNLPPTLSSWLIPRTVTKLLLSFQSEPSYMAQLWSGLPKSLTTLSLPEGLEISQVIRDAIASNLHKLETFTLGPAIFSILRTERGIETEEWSDRRRSFHRLLLNKYVDGDSDITSFASHPSWRW